MSVIVPPSDPKEAFVLLTLCGQEESVEAVISDLSANECNWDTLNWVKFRPKIARSYRAGQFHYLSNSPKTFRCSDYIFRRSAGIRRSADINEMRGDNLSLFNMLYWINESDAVSEDRLLAQICRRCPLLHSAIEKFARDSGIDDGQQLSSKGEHYAVRILTLLGTLQLMSSEHCLNTNEIFKIKDSWNCVPDYEVMESVLKMIILLFVVAEKRCKTAPAAQEVQLKASGGAEGVESAGSNAC